MKNIAWSMQFLDFGKRVILEKIDFSADDFLKFDRKHSCESRAELSFIRGKTSNYVHFRWISNLFYARHMPLFSFDRRERTELRTAFRFARIALDRALFRKIR